MIANAGHGMLFRAIKQIPIRLSSISIACIAATLAACSNTDTSKMLFEASIEQYGNGKIELITKVGNFSTETKTLSDIDIDNELHKTLNLASQAGRTGEYIPFDNTISYTVNKPIAPGDTYTFRLYGREVDSFISGDVDFIVNDDWFNYRTETVSCCR